MTVQDLKKELDKLDDNMLVVISKDSEGNSYSPLSEVSGNSLYTPENNWLGEVSIKELTPELIKQGYTEEDCYKTDESKECIVLWPTN